MRRKRPRLGSGRPPSSGSTARPSLTQETLHRTTSQGRRGLSGGTCRVRRARVEPPTRAPISCCRLKCPSCRGTARAGVHTWQRAVERASRGSSPRGSSPQSTTSSLSSHSPRTTHIFKPEPPRSSSPSRMSQRASSPRSSPRGSPTPTGLYTPRLASPSHGGSSPATGPWRPVATPLPGFRDRRAQSLGPSPAPLPAW